MKALRLGIPKGSLQEATLRLFERAGWARVRGGLSAADFQRPMNVQQLSRAGLARLEESVKTFALCEGLESRARVVEVRG